MSDSSPDARLVEKVQRGPMPAREDRVLVVIPLLYAVAVLVVLTIDVNLHLALGCASTLAYGVVVNVLFRHPP